MTGFPTNSGGPTYTPGDFGATPSPNVAFGTITIGVTARMIITVVNAGGKVTVVSAPVFTGPNAAKFTSPTVFPFNVPAGGSSFFEVDYLPTVGGADSATLSVNWSTTGLGLQVAIFNLTGTGYNPTSGLTLSPNVQFPNTQVLNSNNVQQITVTNPTAGDITVNSLVIADPAFVLDPAITFPRVIGHGTAQLWNITFSPTQVKAYSSDVLLTDSGASTVHSTLIGSGVLLFPISVLTGVTRQIWMAFSPQAIRLLDPTSNNNLDMPSTLTFNGSIWQSAKQEKTMMRIYFLYFNMGVATINWSVTTYRQDTPTPDTPIVISGTVQLGTSAADGREMSDFCDFEISGEIISITLSRPANGGPLNLMAVIPEFEIRGEKVEKV